jgi:two-component system sensor histidine kinase VicK
MLESWGIMINSIKWRLVTIYVLLVIIVMIASGTLIVWLTSNNEYKEIGKELKSAADGLEGAISDSSTIEEVKDVLEAVVSKDKYIYSNKIVYLLDNKGEIVYPVLEKQREKRFYNPQVMAAVNGKQISTYDKVHLYGSNIEYIGYARAGYHNNEVSHIFYILASTGPLKAKLQKTIIIIMIAVVVAIFMATVLGIFFSGFLTKPIIALTKQARDMAMGTIYKPIEVLSDDEIGQLTKDFNIMATSLNDTLSQISSEKNKLETVFAHMTDGILVFDKDSTLIHSNPASVYMLNIKGEQSYKDVFKKYTDLKFLDIMERVDQGTVQHIVEEKSKFYNVCFARYNDIDNTAIGVICVIQDITEHKKLEAMQKEFVANVSHELRTPLTTIKSYTETLIEGAIDEKDIAMKFLDVINHEGDRMTDLVQDLLELSRLDNKQTKFSMQDIKLNHIVEDSIEKYKIHTKKKSQNLIFNSPEKEYRIIGDSNRIEQVVKNIISNAVKYSPEGATITVSMYEKDNDIILSIKDTGMGIPSEDLLRIFERFYRVDKGRSRAMGGTGLGLSIAKEIMEYHGGHIEVESILTEGTTFYLYFPIKTVNE